MLSLSAWSCRLFLPMSWIYRTYHVKGNNNKKSSLTLRGHNWLKTRTLFWKKKTTKQNLTAAYRSCKWEKKSEKNKDKFLFFCSVALHLAYCPFLIPLTDKSACCSYCSSKPVGRQNSSLSWGNVPVKLQQHESGTAFHPKRIFLFHGLIIPSWGTP